MMVKVELMLMLQARRSFGDDGGDDDDDDDDLSNWDNHVMSCDDVDNDLRVTGLQGADDVDDGVDEMGMWQCCMCLLHYCNQTLHCQEVWIHDVHHTGPHPYHLMSTLHQTLPRT